jgi:hypothetical protein
MDLDKILSEKELVGILREGELGAGERPRHVETDETIDELGRRLAEDPSYWTLVKAEMYKFVCTNDKQYAGLRRQLKAAGTKSQTTIVSMIAAAIAVRLGMVFAPLVPLVAAVLIGVIRVGTNAFCKLAELNMKVVGS